MVLGQKIFIFKVAHWKIGGMGQAGGDRRWKSDISGYAVRRQKYWE